MSSTIVYVLHGLMSFMTSIASTGEDKVRAPRNKKRGDPQARSFRKEFFRKHSKGALSERRGTLRVVFMLVYY